jgi:hypothetical protein
MEQSLSILSQAFTITLFVLAMMLIIEYLNVFTRGMWSQGLKKSAWKQILTGSLLGILPGCLGAYTAVSLYVHNVIGVGALVATMIATSGDEAFFMFSIIPEAAILIHIIIFAIAIITGFIVQFFYKKKVVVSCPDKQFEIHQATIEMDRFDFKKIWYQLKTPTLLRSLLIVFLVGVLLFVLFSHDEAHGNILLSMPAMDIHEHPEWIKYTFIAVSVISLFIVITVNNHFLSDHLWSHVLKKHFLRIFLWTLGTMILLFFLTNYLDLENLIRDNLFLVLLAAVLIGIIPESGPHLIFIMLYASGNLPFSILLASSIVQDGHGSLPLLAETRKGFVVVKLINMAAGFIVGGLGLLMGV